MQGRFIVSMQKHLELIRKEKKRGGILCEITYSEKQVCDTGKIMFTHQDERTSSPLLEEAVASVVLVFSKDFLFQGQLRLSITKKLTCTMS